MISFHDFLPSTTPRYRYKGYRESLRLFEEEHDKLQHEEDPLGCAYNPYFIMDIDERSFLEYFVNSEDKLLTLSWEIYDHVYQSALFKMESSEHATAAGAFNTIFSTWARSVTKPFLSNTGTRTVRGVTCTKKADISWTPAEVPSGRSHKWPTFVGEIAWSEPRSKLKADIKFWLEDPESSVNVAITISVLRGRILIERWEVSDNKSPSPTQKIEIIRNPKPGCPQVSGQFEIEFSDVFLREPKPKTRERNFILTIADMHELAAHVWEYQYQFPAG
ncbi:hypothetical protein N7509_011790 [Penicillium cosmopolitanum]|uniref:Uncharacterized protein n=1 Tax=Penicillium cosmopolitanum TaxID=1131564 RepID=A0A9W9VGN0_9EURO|nr:uncharacterized protein N7509_011790 [Penicillium cosmopolitanum]KAJ5378671.1 hypothetical protein N7509_011790 [Penicillium cosmopolitanum]